MIKFFRYNNRYRSPLRILKPPFNAEDFEKSSFCSSVQLFGGLTKFRKGNEVKIVFRKIHYSHLDLRNEDCYPRRSTPGLGLSCALWFTSEADVRRFILENRDIILDMSKEPLNLSKLEPVTEKWSYYILKYQ